MATMADLPPILSLLPSTRRRIRRIFNTTLVAIVTIVFASIHFLVLIGVAILMNMVINALIRQVDFAPNNEGIFSAIPKAYVGTLIVGITIKSILDLLPNLFADDELEIPRPKNE